MDTSPKRPLLPDPSQRPGSDIVVYDGQCRFCTGQVERLMRWDRRGVLSFLSLHDDRIATLCPDLTHDQLMQQMYVVTADARRYAGAAAIRYLSRRLPRLLPLAPLLHIPGSLPIWQWLYRVFARQRYRWGRADSCDSDVCDVHFK